MTLANRLAQMEWLFYEKGMGAIWNELRRFSESTIGTLTGATTFGAIDLANATMVQATANIPNTGAPIIVGGQAPGWGFGQQQNPPPAAIRPPTLNQP